jgi:2-keto-3-deoxy-L-rhamnonate aldolase RhmA
MTEFRNPARVRLARGEVAIGVGVRSSRTVDIAPAMVTAGFDWLFIDLEHGTTSLDTAAQIAVAAHAAGIAPIVRVPRGELTMAARMLDGGAHGIVMPHVDTAGEASAIADALRFPPAGHRSVVGGLPQLGFRSLPAAEAARQINAETLIVVMIESPTAVANADAIAAVPGVDVLLIGTNDLCMEMGLPGQVMHADVVKAYEWVHAACKRHGKWLGLGGVYSEEGMRRYIGVGARLVLAGNDMTFLMQGAAEAARLVRGMG